MLAFWGIAYWQSKPNAQEFHRRATDVLKELLQSWGPEGPGETTSEIIVGILESAYLESYKGSFWDHLAVALAVSIILFLAVELHTRERARKDFQAQIQSVTEKTWEGIGGRLLGPKICQEVDEVLKANAAKQECRYILTFQEVREFNGQECVIVLVENYFQLRNLTGVGGEKFPVLVTLVANPNVGYPPLS